MDGGSRVFYRAPPRHRRRCIRPRRRAAPAACGRRSRGGGSRSSPGRRTCRCRVRGRSGGPRVSAHEVQAGDPGPQRQVKAGENGAAQVVEPFAAAQHSYRWRSGRVSSRPFLTAEVDPQVGHATPSVHRMSRTVWKHLASSKRSWMFTMMRRPGDEIAARARIVPEGRFYRIGRPNASSPRNPS